MSEGDSGDGFRVHRGDGFPEFPPPEFREMLVARTSIEIFANDGQVYMPMGVIGPESNKTLGLLATAGPVKIESLEVHRLRSIWP
jgi:sucrose-6-phosphate hydrolase SacC (GH32 family)